VNGAGDGWFTTTFTGTGTVTFWRCKGTLFGDRPDSRALAPRVPLRQRCFIKLPRQIGTACGPNGRASPLANQLDGYCSSYPRVEGKGETVWGTPSDPRNPGHEWAFRSGSSA
jgi:hypothetical protein